MIKLNSAAIGTASHQVHRILASHFLATSTHGRTASWNRSFSSTSTAPFSMDDCPHRSFAKNHPDIARNILIVPPYSVLDYSFAGLSDLIHQHVSLEKYLHWRGWNIDKILSGFETTGSNVAQSAIGLLSHPLTFPLTLAYHSNVFVNDKQFSIHQAVPQSNDLGDKKVMRLCCVGARAECTLPDGYWREFLVMSSAMIRAHSSDAETNNDANAMKPGESLEWILDFVGPEVPRQIMTKTINIFDDIDDCKGQQTRQKQQQRPNLVMNYHASFLHEVILQFLKSAPQAENRTEKIRQFWDGFVLFNPGLGHPNLEKQWKATMEFLFSTGKPILFTAHSELDAERDALVLEELLAHWNHRDLSYSKECSYENNPFSSRMEFIDPFPPATTKNGGDIHVVRPNHSVLILH